MASYVFKKQTLTFRLVSRALGAGKPESAPAPRPNDNWRAKYFSGDHQIVDSQAELDAFFRM